MKNILEMKSILNGINRLTEKEKVNKLEDIEIETNT